MNRVLGICNLHDTPSMGQLTKTRPLGSLSFLSRYGLMDFTLSNFSNSGIDRMVLLAENNISAVRNHTLDGNIWINNTRTGFLRILLNEKVLDNPKFNTDITNIKEHYSIIEETNPEYIILAPTFFLMSFDFKEMMEFHEESGAEITCLYTKITRGNKEYLNCDSLEIAKNHVITHSKANMGEEKKQNISLETFIFTRAAFDKILALSDRVSSMYGFRKMISYAINHHRIPVHAYEFDGYVVPILSSYDYVEKSFELLKYENRQKLFLPDWPIYTTTHNTPPALYGPKAVVKNSFVANGAIIKGEVENCIISRDVIIEEGAVLKNCIAFTQSFIGKDAKLEYVLLDKKARVCEVKKLAGTKEKVLVIKQGEKV
jgi:glucose-1-phosphate adenylyltransferase